MWFSPFDCPSPVSGPSSDLFSGVLYHGYNPPPGFCWDTLCADDPIMVRVFLPLHELVMAKSSFSLDLKKKKNAKCKIVWRVFTFILNKLYGFSFWIRNETWNFFLKNERLILLYCLQRMTKTWKGIMQIRRPKISWITPNIR